MLLRLLLHPAFTALRETIFIKQENLGQENKSQKANG
jgi:hypothetical protein